MSSYTLNFHEDVVFTPFSTTTPSEITLHTISPLHTQANHRHNSPVLFDETGWTVSTDTYQSTYERADTELPIGDINALFFFTALYGLYLFVSRRLHRCFLLALFIVITLPSLAAITLNFSKQAGCVGDSIAVTPTLSEIPEGTPYLCWKIFYDAACTHEVDGTRFRMTRNGAANSVYFTAPSAGTYYIQTTLRSARQCNADIHEQHTTSFAVYPSDADIVLVRHLQQAGHQIDLRADMPEQKQLYGVMSFEKSTVNDPSLSVYERYNYFISFPFDVRIGDVSGFGTYGRHWLVEYYDGLGRAQNGYWADSEPNWKRIADTDSVLHANQGYMLKLNANRMAADQSDVWANDADVASLYFPALMPVNDIVTRNETIPGLSEEYLCSIDYSSSLGAEADRRIKDSYWRCIGVPSMVEQDADLFAWRTDDLPYLYEWDRSDNSLNVVSGSSFAFEPMHAYLVQNGAPIIWTDVSTPNASVAARKNSSDDLEYELVLLNNGIESDHTFIRLSDHPAVTADFDFGYDLSKEQQNGDNIYTYIGYERVAANCLPFNEDSLSVPIGLQVAQNGSYTLSLRNYPTGPSVVLMDSLTDQRTNLMRDSCTLSLEAGAYPQRFTLLIGVETEVTTGWHNEKPSVSIDGAQKYWYNGMLYIFRDGRFYNVLAQPVTPFGR